MIEQKLSQVRTLLEKYKVDAVRFQSVEWFAWITDGADSSVIFSAPNGVGEVLVTRTNAYVLCSEIEKARFVNETIPVQFEVVSYPWTDSSKVAEIWLPKFADRILSENELTPEWLGLRWTLNSIEIERYRELCKDATRAVQEALSLATPDMTEFELAGIASQKCWALGIHPLLVLVGGNDRAARFRHPIATQSPLGEHAMLVVCARRHGLYANLTRHRYFRDLTDHENQMNRHLLQIEAAAFEGTRALESLDQIYSRIKRKYSELGHENEIDLHHQGGPTGYLSREAIAGIHGMRVPESRTSRAFAWNPSLSGGFKIENTVLLNDQREIEVLTK